MIPCFNRPDDLDRLLTDLASLDEAPGSPLDILVVDNASDPPLTPRIPQGLSVRVIRLRVNTGGSGGFNAGLGALLSQRPGAAEDLFWLLDSDARLEPGSMAALVSALAADPGAVVAGSALAEPGGGPVFELGGHIDRRGEYVQPPPPAAHRGPIVVQYVAACSLMVSRSAVERAGLMPEVFINGDDVEWCLRLRAATGGRILAVPASIARHPRPDKMRTWDRYYAARNAFAALERAGLGGITRFRRAFREAARAACQALVGRDDLAALHLRGLRDALAGQTTGAALAPALFFRPFRPMSELADALLPLQRHGPIMIADVPADEQLRALLASKGLTTARRAPHRTLLGALARLIFGERGVCIVSARARPADWAGCSIVVTTCPQGFALSHAGRWRRIAGAGSVLIRGFSLAASLGLRGPGARPRIPRAPAPATPPRAAPASDLTIVVLSYNRWTALDRTLTALREDPMLVGARVVVVDNASTDGSADLVERNHSDITVLRLGENGGIAGFNRGADPAETELLLILDDDAVPARGVMGAALDLLRQRPDLGAVTLHPKHPASGSSEWPFARHAGGSRDDWPVMGCANLVRTEAWRAVGGYAEPFFLYRNDTDLAMTLAAAGWGVHFNPDWVAWHDSPATARKSLRWFQLAVRNWVWLCRRHGRGPSKVVAILSGWLWAHRQAGTNLPAHARILQGFWAGLSEPAPPLPRGVLRDGRSLRRLLALRWGRGQPPGKNIASIDRHSP